MHPLLLSPTLKDYLWGGHRLPCEYGYSTDLPKVAEAWVLSCHPDGPCVVKNGKEAGRTLADVLDEWGARSWKTDLSEDEPFPILIKLIDACDRLSIQVHPDESYTLTHSDAQAKTEMWYVLDSEPGAQLIFGVNKEMTREEFHSHIEDGTLTDVCRFVPVKKGDVFFIPAGTLHAIGAGILIAEVQQNSATTYRVSDYGRLGADGKPRQLHIQQALEVTRLIPSETEKDIDNQAHGSGERMLADCPYFETQEWILSADTKKLIGKPDTFTSALFLTGGGVIRFGSEEYSFSKGDSLFVPAGCSATIEGETTVLYTTIK